MYTKQYFLCICMCVHAVRGTCVYSVCCRSYMVIYTAFPVVVLHIWHLTSEIPNLFFHGPCQWICFFLASWHCLAASCSVSALNTCTHTHMHLFTQFGCQVCVCLVPHAVHVSTKLLTHVLLVTVLMSCMCVHACEHLVRILC